MAGRIPVHDSEEAAAAAKPGLIYEPIPGADSGHKPSGYPTATPMASGMHITPAGANTGEICIAIECANLFASPTNRKHFDKDKMRELEASVAEAGVIVPLIVRVRKEAGYEIVCGERRWRSVDGANAIRKKANDALKAGEQHTALIHKLPCIVRSMTDVEVVRSQCIENAQREDVSPFDEARSYRALEKYGHSRERIASMVGKSVGTIHAKLKLLELCEDGVNAFEDGLLPESNAIVVARMPLPIQSKIILALVLGRQKPMTFDEFKVAVADGFTVDLAKATFDTEEPFSGRGACKDCDYRSGNCRESCPDVKSPNVCLDPECYRAKREATTQALVERLASFGYEVLSKPDAAKAFTGDSLRPNSAYVEMETKHPSGKRGATWEQLVTKAEKKLPDDAARTPKLALVSPAGRVLRVYERAAAERAIANLVGSRAAEEVQTTDDDKEAKKRAAEDARFREEVAIIVAGRVAQRAKKSGVDVPSLRLLLEELLDPAGAVSGGCLAVCREVLDLPPAGDVSKKIVSLERSDLDALLTVAAMDVGDAFDNNGDYSATLRAYAKMIDADLRALEREVRSLAASEAAIESSKKAAEKLFEK